MSFLSLEETRSIVDGSWILEPASDSEEITGVSIDTRGMQAGNLFVALPGEHSDGHDWLESARRGGAAALLVRQGHREESTGGRVPMLAVADPVAALWALASAWRECLTAHTVAITGSAGKTTVRSMLQAILERAAGEHSCTASERSFNNHLGLPLTILRARRGEQFLVVELGTNAPGEIARLASLARPATAIITNIGRAHLAGLGSIEGVAREKASLLGELSSGATAIIPVQGGELERAAAEVLPEGVTLVTFGGDGADVALRERHHLDPTGAQIVRLQDGFEARIRLPGAHNARNALAAIAAARSLGIADRVIGEALAELPPDAMRLQVEELGDPGTMLFNDAYNAHPDAVIASLEAFAEASGEASRRVVILGDMLELGADEVSLHEECGRTLSELNRRVRIDVAIFIGPLSQNTARALQETGFEHLIVRVPSLHDDLLEAVAAVVLEGDAVLIKASRAMHLERLIDAVRANTNRVEHALTQRS